MLFYTTLLITSFLLTLVIIGLKNLIVSVARKSFSFGKRDAKAGPTAWGTQPHATPANLAKTHPAAALSTPWGWPGNDHKVRENHAEPAAANGASLNAYLARKNDKHQTTSDWKRNSGRPVRGGRSLLAGYAYKPSEDAILRYGIEK